MADKEKQIEYQKKYAQKRILKHVSFNTEKEQDLLDEVKKLDFSRWVKEKLRERIKK
ncbi:MULTISPECIES: hypothetical protein [Neisseria]|uniref:hypothetical protein n=1 Tax=Neisseria meningitidis TaxID=487 RepID=UPI0013DECB41|nr:hypothetical protein [Neisseria meningitidis]